MRHDVSMISLLRILSCYNLSRKVIEPVVTPLLKAADEKGSFAALFNISKFYGHHS